MSLEIYQIITLLLIGALVGISISFVGQTGQGVVLPIVLLLTGDAFLAIAINLLNDFITSIFVSIVYIRKKEFKIRKDTLIIIIVALLFSLLGVFILLITPIGNIYGWFIPLFITILGFVFLYRGFPTTETLRRTAYNLSQKFLKKSSNTEIFNKKEKKPDEKFGTEVDIQGFILSGSKLFYILALVFGIIIGLNSGLFGANSGFIIVLALVVIYGYPIKKGVGTALMLSIVMCLGTFLVYQFLGITIKGQFFFDLEISLFLAIGSIITGIIASLYVQRLSAKTMGRGVGIIIFMLGIISLIIYFIS
ncbi:MAG: sulfite exporter TauE/SafE family protein [Candidatus Lokiarchaeota archaeon]|nr:sulfite exporter TauE/SafE family protein [Candidatus Lokiarchaeota archaeon]